MAAGAQLEKLKPLQETTPADQQGTPRADPDPSTGAAKPPVQPRTRFQAAAIYNRQCNARGPADVGAPNDWQGLPQWHMEARAMYETVDVQQGFDQVVLDLAFANAFYVDLTGDTRIVLSGMPPVGPHQPDRPRAVAVSLTVRRNGHQLEFDDSIKWPDLGEKEFDFDKAVDTWDDFAFKGLAGGSLNQAPGWPGPGGLWFGYVTGLNRK